MDTINIITVLNHIENLVSTVTRIYVIFDVQNILITGNNITIFMANGEKIYASSFYELVYSFLIPYFKSKMNVEKVLKLTDEEFDKVKRCNDSVDILSRDSVKTFLGFGIVEVKSKSLNY